ncbi:hypothetical protein O3M35_002012 [Rhynocoris fuscipes]|uniref:Uncharacterized protein n=1 Tax=Rhynocoris fuscipes TaxID=488301 RepID=A0AAW1CQY1_9HEMI
MLRSRRRDANVKPNRVLDRNSSRGMIYENEELRLRTININAEIERGQSDIKKLRRENDHLRREIWALREECDRLQELLKQRVSYLFIFFFFNLQFCLLIQCQFKIYVCLKNIKRNIKKL